MAIIKTKPFFLVGILKDKKQILEKIQILKCCQIKQIDYLKKVSLNKTLNKIGKMKQTLEKSIEIISKVCDMHQDDKNLITISDFKNSSKNVYKFYKKSKSILIVNDRIDLLKKTIKTLEDKKLKLKAYNKIEIPLKSFKTKNTTSKILKISGCYDEQELEKILSGISKNIYFHIISSDKTQTILLMVMIDEYIENVKDVLLKNGFSQIDVTTTKTPKEEILKYDGHIIQLKNEIDILTREIEDQKNSLKEIKLASDYLSFKENECLEAEKMISTKNSFILKGFLNPKLEDTLKKVLSKFNSKIIMIDGDDNCPVFFSNNFFATPVQEITKTYAMPSKNDIDPNPLMSIFYYAFFGMMFSDAGYGIVLTLFCAISLTFKKLSKIKNSLKMFLFCGLSTTFWGFMYGSFFGNAIFTISKKFFNSNFSLSPLWINTTKEPLLLLLFSIVIGIIQIIVGLLIKFYVLLKQKKIKQALFTILNWILTLMGIQIFLIGYIYKISSIFIVAKILICFGFFITLVFSGYEAKGILKIFKGIINLYGISSYISDMLSYSRLMALGIATGVIADVVNILAGLSQNSISGIIMFIVIFLIGHILNFSINILGAYVHTNRLQYVEFFNKFYTGGGESFSPFSTNLKYFNLLKK